MRGAFAGGRGEQGGGLAAARRVRGEMACYTAKNSQHNAHTTPAAVALNIDEVVSWAASDGGRSGLYDFAALHNVQDCGTFSLSKSR